jgi:hypothetical protein
MNSRTFTLAAALMLTLTASTFAQLTSSPLEPGLYDTMKRTTSVTLIGNDVMRLGTTRIEYVSPEQVTVSAVVIDASDKGIRQKVERLVSEYNEHATLGTMTIDANGRVTIYQHLNPKQVNVARMAKVVVLFNGAIAEQSRRFAPLFATN